MTETPERRERCDHCQHAEKIPLSLPPAWQCHREPPNGFMSQAGPGRFFTFVKPDDWCGEFRLAENRTQTKSQTSGADHGGNHGRQ